MNQKQKRFIRRVLQILRLEKPFRFLYRKWSQYRLYRQYGNIQQFEFDIEGVKVLFSTEDLYSKRHLLGDTDNIYEAHITEIMAKYVKNCKCFVDVGAHIGYFTCIAGKLSPQAQIHAFEMDNVNFQLLQKNITLNKLQNVQAHQAAVTNSDREVQYIKETDAASSGFELSNDPQRDSKFGALVSVKAVALDTFFADKPVKPDVIKIDVEGAELQVLEGMRQLLANSSPHIFVEVHPEKILNFNASIAQVLELLFASGYEIEEHEKLKTDNIRRLTPTSTVMHNNVLHAWKA